MAQRRADHEQLSRDELALMAAFEARTGDGADDLDQVEQPAELPADLQAELTDFVALTAQIAALDDVPDMDPAVRGRVLSAAITQRDAAAEPRGLAAWLLTLMRPAPMAAMGLLAAVLVAVVVRPHAPTAAGDSALRPSRGETGQVALIKLPAAPGAPGAQAASDEAARPDVPKAPGAEAAGVVPRAKARGNSPPTAEPSQGVAPTDAPEPQRPGRAKAAPRAAKTVEKFTVERFTGKTANPGRKRPRRRLRRRTKLFAARPASLGPSQPDAPVLAKTAPTAPPQRLRDRLASATVKAEAESLAPKSDAAAAENDDLAPIRAAAKPTITAKRGEQSAAHPTGRAKRAAAAGVADVTREARAAASSSPAPSSPAPSSPAPSSPAPGSPTPKVAPARRPRAANSRSTADSTSRKKAAQATLQQLKTNEANRARAKLTHIKTLMRQVEKTKVVAKRRALLNKLLQLATAEGKPTAVKWARRHLAALPAAPAKAKKAGSSGK